MREEITFWIYFGIETKERCPSLYYLSQHELSILFLNNFYKACGFFDISGFSTLAHKLQLEEVTQDDQSGSQVPQSETKFRASLPWGSKNNTVEVKPNLTRSKSAVEQLSLPTDVTVVTNESDTEDTEQETKVDRCDSLPQMIRIDTNSSKSGGGDLMTGRSDDESTFALSKNPSHLDFEKEKRNSKAEETGEGAEKLAFVVNLFFGEMIELVAAHGGDVIKVCHFGELQTRF